MIKYRPDIDGTRAVAVSAVVAYHLAPKALPGGYLGVDIFFVLSGFLITSIIWSEIKEAQFTIGAFYERRIRRIMPALIAVLIVTTVASISVLLPADLIGYGKSLFATLAFVANVYFWRDTDYFSRLAEEKPLLHLWSLGVEEQFYVLFPLFLVALARFWPKATIPALLSITLGSLCINILLNAVGGASPAFFLLPSRAWELCGGALLALLPGHSAPNGRIISMISIAGAILIVASLLGLLKLSANLPVALPAVVGTCLLVWAGNFRTTYVSATLSRSMPVFVGKISYSLYLWHWPVIVLARYRLVRDLTLVETILALCLMIALAVVSWRYIEQPFRTKRITFKSVGAVVVSATAALAGLAGTVVLSSGLPSRLSAEATTINAAVGTNYRCDITSYMPFGSSRACVLNLPSRLPSDADTVLFGNSHAQMYAPLVESLLRQQGAHGLLVPMNGCLPTVTINVFPVCFAMARANLEEILKLDRVRTVIIGLTWDNEKYGLLDETGALKHESPDTVLVEALDDLIARINARGKRVVLIGPITTPGWDIASILSRERAFGIRSEHTTEVPRSVFEGLHSKALTHFSNRQDVQFIPAYEVQCDTSRCTYLLEGRSLFADSNHIAKAELHRFKAMFAEAMNAK